MASISIRKIVYSSPTPPTGSQVLTVQIKLSTQPESAYSTVTSSLSAGTDGSLSSPLVISSLSSGSTYNVRISNNCGGAYWVETIVAP